MSEIQSLICILWTSLFRSTGFVTLSISSEFISKCKNRIHLWSFFLSRLGKGGRFLKETCVFSNVTTCKLLDVCDSSSNMRFQASRLADQALPETCLVASLPLPLRMHCLYRNCINPPGAHPQRSSPSQWIQIIKLRRKLYIENWMQDDTCFPGGVWKCKRKLKTHIRCLAIVSHCVTVQSWARWPIVTCLCHLCSTSNHGGF